MLQPPAPHNHTLAHPGPRRMSSEVWSTPRRTDSRNNSPYALVMDLSHESLVPRMWPRSWNGERYRFLAGLLLCPWHSTPVREHGPRRARVKCLSKCRIQGRGLSDPGLRAVFPLSLLFWFSYLKSFTLLGIVLMVRTEGLLWWYSQSFQQDSSSI